MSRRPLYRRVRILGMYLPGLYTLYRQHWREHRATELMAGTGIAIGVSLVLGVLVANNSILGSTREVIDSVNGSANLDLVARSPRGFSQELTQQVSELSGVQAAVPVLRQSAVIEGPKGRLLIQLTGISPRIVALHSLATKDLGAGARLLQGGIGLPSDVADSVGAQPEGYARLLVNGNAYTARIRAVLNSGTIGVVAASRIVVALLPTVQHIVRAPGRITQLLIKTYPGRTQQVTNELLGLAGGKLNVEPSNYEFTLASTALRPTSQSTSLFAAISLMVGFLLALNAMLLVIPERRRHIADLREVGYVRKQIVAILGTQALVLGVGASLVGVVVGEVLARTIFDAVPNYLATTFQITGHQQASFFAIFISFSCGVAAALLASMLPLLDLRKARAVDAVFTEAGEPGQRISSDLTRNAALLGLAIIVAATAMAVLDAGLTIPSGVALALATPCFIPLLFRETTRLLRHIARHYHGKMVAIATIELDATATRSVALACITALAVYGSTAVGGARTDLLHGIDTGIEQEWSTAPVWVTPDQNIFDTDTFHVKNAAAAIHREPGVASVSIHQGAFLDVGSQRLWIRAAEPGNPSLILSSEMRQGDIARARRLMRGSGWATVSSGFADERGLSVGSRFYLPTPAEVVPFRVAAITTNIGWPPGTITLNTNEFGRYWQTNDPTTLAIQLKPGVSPKAGTRVVRDALGPTNALRVQTSEERIGEVRAIGRQGLSVLGGISNLLLLISAIALASAISAAIYQRRGRLASLKAQGFVRRQLWRGVLLETTVVLGIGGVDGVILGFYGHALADRYLRVSTSFPAPFSLTALQTFLTLLALVGASLVAVSIPGYAAAGVAPDLSFQD